MIAVDTNILVYSHREDTAWFELAREIVRSLAEGAEPWSAGRDFGRFPGLKARNPLVS